MNKSVITYIITLICLILAQVLICNHIVLFNVAIAFVFIYAIIRLPMDMNTNWLLTIAFFIGLIVDIFSDTPGVNALACTLIAMFKKPMLYAYTAKDDRTKNIVPTLATLGFGIYGKFLFTVSIVYCLLTFSIEYFSLADIKEIVIMTASSGVLTFVLLLGIDGLMVRGGKQ